MLKYAMQKIPQIDLNSNTRKVGKITVFYPVTGKIVSPRDVFYADVISDYFSS